MTRYALDDGRVGSYVVYDEFVDAVQAANGALLMGVASVTVIRVDGPANDLRFRPLFTVVPPITPPPTSPRGAA